MKRAKKDRPKVAAFEQSCPGLAPRNVYMIIMEALIKEALIKASKSQANRRRQWKRPIKNHIGG